MAPAARRAPGFALPDSKMKVYDLADYRGKIVVLEFMQTTCPHCAAFADMLRQVEQKYAGRVQMLAVVKSPEDNANTVASTSPATRWITPILFDAGQMAYSYILSSNLEFPHIYVIDGNGYIHADHVYSITTRDIFEGKALFTELDRLLGAGAPKKK